MRDGGRSDEWTKKARAEGYAARSVYKLEELARREPKLLPRKGKVLDLGCSPGSWTQYLMRNGTRKLHLVGLDISRIDDYAGTTFLQRSALKVHPRELLNELGGLAKFVMSDMAPFTKGDRFSDHIRQLELAHAALRLARATLQPGGNFVVKVFEGQDAPAYVDEVRQHFTRVRRLRPKVVRRESVEFFVAGIGFKQSSRLRDADFGPFVPYVEDEDEDEVEAG